MRDPRLAEIEFLTAIERSGTLYITSNTPGVTHSDLLSGASDRTEHPTTDRPRRRFGMSVEHWRDMVLHLLLSEFIVGHMRRNSQAVNELELRHERIHLSAQLMGAQSIHVHVSHAGRVHLWNLRDALLRDADLEPFGLRSRAAWDRDLFVRLRFASEESPLSVIFLDLDNFGAVNKKFGATVGDAVLRVVFGLMKNIVGTRGAAYRYGGEEVGVLLPGVTQADAATIAEDLRATIEQETRTQVPKLTSAQTASIGVMAFAGPADNDTIVDLVDALMVKAKKAGKNRVEIAA